MSMQRVSFKSILVAMVMLELALTTAGCGSASRSIDDSAATDLPPCLNCNQDAQDDSDVHFSQVPRVYVTPDELMFYADLSSEGFDTQLAQVTNSTNDNVWVTDVYVANSSEPNS